MYIYLPTYLQTSMLLLVEATISCNGDIMTTHELGMDGCHWMADRGKCKGCLYTP